MNEGIAAKVTCLLGEAFYLFDQLGAQCDKAGRSASPHFSALKAISALLSVLLSVLILFLVITGI
jgi:hypothetical protein